MEIGPTALLCAASLVAAGVLAVRAIRPGADRAAAAAHVLMGLGMAGMFSPWGDPTPPMLGAAVFAVAAAWFLAQRLRSGASDDGLHLVVGPAAMVLMYLTAPAAGSAPGGGHAGHAGHAAATGGTVGSFVPVVALALAGYFVWHAWHVLRSPDAAAVGDTAVAARVGIEPLAHAVLSALMAIMFLVGI